jgi:hypothetical protein
MYLVRFNEEAMPTPGDYCYLTEAGAPFEYERLEQAREDARKMLAGDAEVSSLVHDMFNYDPNVVWVEVVEARRVGERMRKQEPAGSGSEQEPAGVDF